MTTPPKLFPCQIGNRCARGGEGCEDHNLHPDDWFLDPDDPRREEPATDAERLRYIDAQWACETCPFQKGCEARGMLPENRRHGIWGGRTVRQRDELAAELKQNHEDHEALVSRMIKRRPLT